MTDRGVLGAVAASVLLHGLALGVGGFSPGGVQAPPRLLEARLLPEVPPEKPAVSAPAEPLAPPHAKPEASRPVSHRAPAAPPTAPAPARLVSEASPDRVLPAVASGAGSTSPTPVAQGAPVASTASAVSSAATGSAASAPSYSPPSFGAGYLHNPKPAYPMMARRRGLEGTVRLDVRVAADGVPTAVKVRESSGHESLDETAVTAVWHWRFVPAKRGGEPIEDTVVVPVRFKLGDDAG